jgi:hypothetical protein
VAALAAAGRGRNRGGSPGWPGMLGLRLGGASGLGQPPGRGGGDRREAGRSARDDAADRSALGEGVAGASQLRLALRSMGEGARGPYGAVGAEAVFAERRKLDDEVER